MSENKKLVIRNIGLLLTDKIEAPIAGEDCGVAIDGIVRTTRSRNTPPAERLPEVVQG